MNLEDLYTELDGELNAVEWTLGRGCAPGCGACCRRPTRHIEASAAEFEPLARRLWESGEAESVLEAAKRAGAEGWCVLYQRGPDHPYPQGRCGAYQNRPLVCRLFGAAAVRDKTGRPQPTWSQIQLQTDPDLPQRFARLVSEGWVPPLAAEWRLRLAAVVPEAAGALLPLNDALARALEREGLRRSLAEKPGEEPR